ncbi:DUF6422 family protein [Piscinibacterium candidicorallinum]|uniref:DUF6422 family protein n=1 Tax=Piscinibacterium candidicorallinum TaxID=1793872 RepID=A0ABV7H1E6_9BURK
MRKLSEGLDPEQEAAFEEAAYVVIKARQQAAERLERAGIHIDLDPSPFAAHCSARLPAPPPNRFCGCPAYRGDGGPCINRFTDFDAPDFGEGPSQRPCRHPPSAHIIAP